MIINREYQREVLVILRDKYPDWVEYKDVYSAFNRMFPDADSLDPIDDNLQYLGEHGLIVLEMEDRSTTLIAFVKATVKGIDHIEADGGLSAILSTVTVKFDADNIRSLIEDGLLQANLPAKKLRAIRKALSNVPGVVLHAVLTTFVQQAMANPAQFAKTVAGILGVPM